jgi:hypothetical protein
MLGWVLEQRDEWLRITGHNKGLTVSQLEDSSKK